MEAPGERPPDDRWAPDTLVRTPAGDRARVLSSYAADVSNPTGGDSVFVQPLCRPERPWQLWSSSELTEITAPDAT